MADTLFSYQVATTEWTEPAGQTVKVIIEYDIVENGNDSRFNYRVRLDRGITGLDPFGANYTIKGYFNARGYGGSGVYETIDTGTFNAKSGVVQSGYTDIEGSVYRLDFSCDLTISVTYDKSGASASSGKVIIDSASNVDYSVDIPRTFYYMTAATSGSCKPVLVAATDMTPDPPYQFDWRMLDYVNNHIEFRYTLKSITAYNKTFDIDLYVAALDSTGQIIGEEIRLTKYDGSELHFSAGPMATMLYDELLYIPYVDDFSGIAVYEKREDSFVPPVTKFKLDKKYVKIPTTFTVNESVRIGDNPVFIFKKGNPDSYVNLSYDLGDGEVVFASNIRTDTYSGWQIPYDFYPLLEDTGSKDITVICRAYYGTNTFINMTSTTMTILGFSSSYASVNSGYVGTSVKVNISNWHEGYVVDLTYKFGSLSGTIATKTSSSSFWWSIPTSFYYEMPNDRTKECELICKTYMVNNGEYHLVGSQTTTCTVVIFENDVKPTMSPTVIDSRSATVTASGNSSKLIRTQSTAKATMNAVAKNGATIVSQSIQCGSNIIYSGSGSFEYVDNNVFIFTATDSRGLTVTQTLTIDMIEYFTPTINVKAVADIEGNMVINLTGMCYRGSFGAASNTQTIQYHYISNEDPYYGEWLTAAATFNGNSYSFKTTFTGLDYRNTYYIEARIIDKFNTVNSPEVITRATPVFDWCNDDFNFNVPVTYSDGAKVYSISEITKKMTGLANAVSKVYEFPVRMTAGTNYSSATGSAALIGNTLRCTMNLVRKSLTNEGNVANEKCCTISIEHGGKINTLIYNSIVNGQTGVVATFYPANVSQTYETIDFDIYLAATANGGTEFSCYFTMPVTLNLEEFIE